MPGAIREVRSPLVVGAWKEAWKEALRDHPDQRFSAYIITGLLGGFHIGFDWSHGLLSATKNLLLAIKQRDVLAGYLEKELVLGRFIGPFQPNPAWQINRVGVIPRGHTPGSGR